MNNFELKKYTYNFRCQGVTSPKEHNLVKTFRTLQLLTDFEGAEKRETRYKLLKYEN
jgi:hypothetical protein